MPPPLTAALAGLAFGLSLIIAIGAQNAFVLRQGLRREHVGVVVAICAGSDLLLIAAGVAGLGTAVSGAPVLLDIARWGGALVLATYAARAAWRSARPASAEIRAGRTGPATRAATIGTVLALTWLNPHVYLDTVLLLGSVAGGHGEQRWSFALGAGVASCLWFAGLGFGARVLTPVFERPTSWRVLDGAIAVVMVAVAASLVVRA